MKKYLDPQKSRQLDTHRFTNWSVWIFLIIFVSSAILVGAFYFLRGLSLLSLSNRYQITNTNYVGSETCIGCHKPEGELWKASHHKRAMDHATEKSVLGDFSNTTFEHFGTRSRFFRKDRGYYVETDGHDGRLATFAIKFTFGFDPLQQYLIEFPDGRLQALSIAWDSRPKDKGGQRWFHLYPNEKISHDDVLHWTRLNQNWNFMCSECHSTGVRKNYDASADRFSTSWTEISVGCETCHGQGGPHVSWARKQQSWWPFGKIEDHKKGLAVQFDELRHMVWELDQKSGNAKRSTPPASVRKEVETCGLCHARRGQISEDWVPGRPLSNTHAVTPLSRGLYHADGQDLDEVYNYGSFKQSKMFAAGVTCSDCHNPHSGKTRLSGDNVCLQCHASDKYTAVSHHQHPDLSPALPCASCHMPSRNYMVVDSRHDHSFRIPRPDLSAKFATPNTCNDCHTNKSPEWAASAIERWHGPDRKGYQKYLEAFHSAWSNQKDAAGLLAAVAGDRSASAIARAGAFAELRAFRSSVGMDLIRAGLADSDPMVRIGAMEMLDGVPANQQWPLLSPLLIDPIRNVRVRAVSSLAGMNTARMSVEDRNRFERAESEFVAAQQLNADRPEARSALGYFLSQRGRIDQAEIEYKAALRLSPQFAPAAINLADLFRELGRESEGEKVLSEALQTSPHDGELHHARGLALIRLKQFDEAIEALGSATKLEPDRARYLYVYAVALQSVGRAPDALAVLQQNLTRHPNDPDTLSALIALQREAGNLDAALKYAEQLGLIHPDDKNLDQLLKELRVQKSKSKAQ